MFLFALIIDWINVFGRSTRKVQKKNRASLRARAATCELYFTLRLLALHTRTIKLLPIKCNVTRQSE